MNLWILAVAAALVVQVSALVPTCQPPDSHGYCISQGVDNCAPEDRLITSLTDQCRTSSRFSPDRILPPEWELMFDFFDYESLVGPVFLSREFDNDGDVSTVADQWEDRSGICQRGLRVCGHTLGAQDNWVFSPHIKYPPGSTTLGGSLPTEIYFNVSFRFTQCSGACVNNFADLYRFDTNDIASESVQTDRSNYLSTPLFGTGTEITTSRLDQTGSSGTVSDTRTLTIASPSSSRTNGFHFGIRDSGNCGQINRIYFYYTPCEKRQDGLINYPELVRAPSGSPPNEGMACCAPNAHPTTSLTFRAHSATDGTTGDEGCERNVRCECDAGYRLNAAGTGCQVCLAGTYRSLTDEQGTCLDCPMNTAMDMEGAAICRCLDGFFRDKQTNEGPVVTCTPPPGPVRNLRTTTITSTSVSLSWTRPEVTGRDDFYYSIEYSDPNTGSFILSNGNYVNSALTVSYTVPNLRPNTPYTIRVTTHNGVSDQDTENEALRRVDLPTRTGEGVPSVPRDVQVFSGVVVWGPPAESNGVITGYQLRFSGSFTRTVNKLPSESYHVVTDDNIGNLGSNIQVSVRARTSAGSGLYSSLIQYIGNSCPPTITPFTCPPTPTPMDCPTVTCPPIPTPTECPTVTYPPTPTPTDCPTVTCPPTPPPRDCPPTVTCPPTPTPTDCPIVTCPPTSTPTNCPTVTCPPTPTPRDCPRTVTCPPTPTPRDCPIVTTDCPTVTCPPTSTPRDCPTVTCPPTSTPGNPTSSNSTDLPDITPVGENLFVIKCGYLVSCQRQMTTINMFTEDSQIEKRQTTNMPSLNVNVTIDPAQTRFRVPRERLVSGQIYTVRARLIVANQVVWTTAPFTFTYKGTDPVLFSPQSAAASGYVDGTYVAVGIILTFLITAIIVALLVIILSWLFITCRIKSGYYSLNTKKQHKC